MNLYYAVSNYHILCCILDAIKNDNNKNILYISKWNPNYVNLCNKINKTHIFSDVKVYNEIEYPSKNKKISIDEIKNDINYILNNIPNDFKKDVLKSANINICGDHYSCSVYLVKNKIKYNYFEDASGILSNKERLFKYIKKIEYSRYQIMKYLKLPGEHKYIVNRYGNLEKQLDGYYNKKDIDFSVNNILSQLDNKTFDEIYDVFCDQKFKFNDGSNLFLTFHYCNLGMLSLESQRIFFSTLIDYFCEKEQLIIKPHPSDIQPNYNKWFYSEKVLPSSMPSELLPYISKKGFNKIITPYSTAIYSLEKYCNHIISFDENIDKEYQLFHQYNFATYLLKNICLKNDYDIIYYCANNKMLKNFIFNNELDNYKFIDISKIKDNHIKNSIIVLDIKYYGINYISMLENNNIIILINETINGIISNKNDINKVCLFDLKKKIANSKRESLFNEFDSEQVFVIFPTMNIKNIFLKLKYIKHLKYTNVIIESFFYTFVEYLYSINNYLKSDCESLNNKILLLEKKVKDYDQIVSDNEQLVNKLKQRENDINSLTKSYNNVINSSSWKLTSGYRKIGFHIKKFFKIDRKKEE